MITVETYLSLQDKPVVYWRKFNNVLCEVSQVENLYGDVYRVSYLYNDRICTAICDNFCLLEN